MNIDYKKLERQQIGVDKWFNSSEHGANKNCRGTLHYFTGVGKTYTAILIIKRLFRTDDKHNVVVLVHSEAMRNQWLDLLEQQFTKKALNRIEVYSKSYILVNGLRVKTNTLIADELDEYYSEEFIGCINGKYIQYNNNLGLTASYEDSKNRHKSIMSLFPVIDEISEGEAIERGYVSKYIEFNLAVSLTAKEKIEYERLTKIITQNISKFGRGGLDLATKCLGGGKHSDGRKYDGKHFVYGWASSKGWRRNLDLKDPVQNEINELWNPHKIYGYAQNLLNSIRHRKNILYNAENKYEICLAIASSFPKLKTIMFSQSTAFADKLNLLLNEHEIDCSVVYHSQLQTIMQPSPKTGKMIKFGKTRLKRLALEAIKTGKSRILCTASSLDKGLDITDLTVGVTASGTSNFTQYKQRGGRVKRVNLFNKESVAILINLYVKDSKEEVWLKKRQSKIDHYIHPINFVHEITLNPIKKVINIEDI